jgi:F-type H+-transporting ATPase subunit gamma
MVATAKMRRTQQQALAGRPYTEKIRQVIADIAIEPGIAGRVLPLLEKREVD